MNRRDFLVSTGAAAGAAALPVAQGAAATAPPARYAWAAAMAKARGHVSAKVLAQGLKLSTNEAMALLSQLQARGVVGALGANGVARAATPILRSGVATSARLGSGSRLAKTVTDQAEQALHRALRAPRISGDDPAPPEASDAERSAE